MGKPVNRHNFNLSMVSPIMVLPIMVSPMMVSPILVPEYF